MKKKVLLILTLLLVVYCSILIPSVQGCYLEDRNTNEYYYWSSSDHIYVHNCSYAKSYSLVLGTNLKASERMTINWTATFGSYRVDFKQSNDPLDDANNRVAQLEIALYENDVLMDTTYRTVMYYDDQWDMGLMINLIVMLIPFLIVGSLIIGIVYYYFNLR